MADLLLELFSEEIPARMQVNAARDFLKILQQNLSGLGEKLEGESWVTPRRLGMHITGIQPKVEASVVTIRGPKTSAPDAALEGFFKKNGLDKSQLRIDGEYYYASVNKPATTATEIMGGIIENTITNFSWLKSMRWGNNQISWVRPLHSILCLFDGKVLPLRYGHIESGSFTFGHRFMAPGKISIEPGSENSFEQYKQKLAAAKVIRTTEARKEKILFDIENLLAGKSLKLREDADLLEEIAGLVEYPFTLLGKINDEFMDLPEEVLVITLKHHQRYLMLEEASGKLAPYFIIVANMLTDDGGAEIIRGNSKVLRARLSDARFFYEGDKYLKLISRLENLKKLTFHQSIGSVYDKVERVKKLIVKLADILGLNPVLASRAAELCKSDLVTNMVKEFPELQGIMGYYYALQDGEHEEVAMAIRDHYKPQGPSDAIPANAIGAILAIADKLDTLQEMFAIGIRPTGSKDPFALRRAAIGISRIIDAHNLVLNLSELSAQLGISDDVISFIYSKSFKS